MTYQWWRFLHILGALGFLAAHGISIGVAFRARKERDRARIAALLELSSRSIIWMYVSLLALIASGVVLGFTLRAWSRGWIWTAIGILVAMFAAMYALAMPYYRRLREIATAERAGGFKHSEEELTDMASSSRPILLAVIGFGGLVAIVYLMVFRPF